MPLEFAAFRKPWPYLRLPVTAAAIFSATLGVAQAQDFCAKVDRLIDQHVAEVFQRVSQLVEIRYQELDRLTLHGQLPVPPDSSLNKILERVQSGGLNR